MGVFTSFTLIFHGIGLMALIFLTTNNKNPANLPPVPAICYYDGVSLRTKIAFRGRANKLVT